MLPWVFIGLATVSSVEVKDKVIASVIAQPIADPSVNFINIFTSVNCGISKASVGNNEALTKWLN